MGAGYAAGSAEGSFGSIVGPDSSSVPERGGRKREVEAEGTGEFSAAGQEPLTERCPL